MKNYVRTNITLPRELAAELKKRVPKRSYSRYISEAIEERLDNERSFSFLEGAGILAGSKTLKESKKILDKIEEMDIADMKELMKMFKK